MTYCKSRFCKNCQKETGALLSGGLEYLYLFLLVLGIIPGVIFRLMTTGNRCGLCKLYYKKASKINK